MLFVTESLTLMAGNSSSPRSSIWWSRCTPVVVSSLTPTMAGTTRPHQPGSSARSRLSALFSASSSFEPAGRSRMDGSRSARKPRCANSVASPPSSTMSVGPSGSPPAGFGNRNDCSRHHQYSSSVSPFQANTGTPAAAMAAAAWSWVLKMLQLDHRTSAPSSTRVSMRTAVWIVMCNEPVIRAPASGLDGP